MAREGPKGALACGLLPAFHGEAAEPYDAGTVFEFVREAFADGFESWKGCGFEGFGRLVGGSGESFQRGELGSREVVIESGVREEFGTSPGSGGGHVFSMGWGRQQKAGGNAGSKFVFSKFRPRRFACARKIRSGCR